MVSGLPSGVTGSGEVERSTPRFTYTRQFERVFPYYLSIGMSYEQYWEMDCDLVKYYRKAADIKRDLMNQNAWLVGLYVYEAIGDNAPILNIAAKKGTKPLPYRASPFELNVKSDDSGSKKKKERSSDMKAKAVMEMFMVANNKKFEKSGETDAGQRGNTGIGIPDKK